MMAVHVTYLHIAYTNFNHRMKFKKQKKNKNRRKTSQNFVASQLFEYENQIENSIFVRKRMKQKKVENNFE